MATAARNLLAASTRATNRDAQSRHRRIASPIEVPPGRGAEGRAEVAGEVRLVGVAELGGEPGEARGAGLGQEVDRLLAAEALEEVLRGRADVAGEEPLEGAGRDRELGGELG